MNIVACTLLVSANHMHTILSDKGLRYRAYRSAVNHGLEVIGEPARLDVIIVTMIALLGRVTGETVYQIFPCFAIEDTRAQAVHACHNKCVLLGAGTQGQHDVIDVDFFPEVIIGFGYQLPHVGGIFGNVGGCQILLITLKFLDKSLSGVNTGGFSVGNLLLVKHKALHILVQGLFLDLLLIVFVIKVLKLRELDLFAVDGHQDRILLLGKGEDHNTQQQRRNQKFSFHLL